ncbi:hypothetical protein [Bradyrhizobium lablabi]
MRGDTSFAKRDGTFTPRGSAAWAHDFNVTDAAWCILCRQGRCAGA